MQKRKKKNKILPVCFSCLLLIVGVCCSKSDFSKAIQVSCEPFIYPDYTDIVIPPNIAPLNFMVSDSFDRVIATLKGTKGEMQVKGRRKISFKDHFFKVFLEENKGDTIWIEVAARKDGKWIKYSPFFWFVANEPIDPWLTYRLIEPGYEVWNKINISLRNVTNFQVKVIADNNMADNACMNCHTANKQNPEMSFFHIRHSKRGGTIVNERGHLRKINTTSDKTISAGVYGSWHPRGRFIAFSTNIIVPAFYSVPHKKMEVYDATSDLVILDLKRNEIFSGEAISQEGKFETFPEFSADGKRLFFCVADSVKLPDDYKFLKYNLCVVDFDTASRTFGEKVDTIFSADRYNKTVSEPRVSPDGKYILVTVFDYGTFPIWHSEAKLNLIDLKTGEINPLPDVNNNKKYSNSYHCWSSNSRWIVFASKRENGLYGMPYFAYIDKKGQGHKSFVLPQRNPEFYGYFYKSFNIPELFAVQPNFGVADIERIFKEPAEKVTFIGGR